MERKVPMSHKKRLAILGCRGIPAKHGGFETFAEQLALFLVRRGWDVTVYCQTAGNGKPHADIWCGVRRVHLPTPQAGPTGTILFDWFSTLKAMRQDALCLVLGYNTAIFSVVYKFSRNRCLINMDGIEWRRAKWSLPARIWLYFNEWFGCLFADHLIADNPEIAVHLEEKVNASKISMIPYCASAVLEADVSKLHAYGLAPAGYALVIARPEPENSIEEIVSAFSAKPRGYPLVVLGNYDIASNPYHLRVKSAASREVHFVGAIYESDVVSALRRHARIYCHGHQVGGTNPSLVESLAAGTPVLAHDNRFNRWVCGPDMPYFSNKDDCSSQLDRFLSNDDALNKLRLLSRRRHSEEFTCEKVLGAYETLLEQWC